MPRSSMKTPAALASLLLLLLAFSLVSREPQADARLKNSYRRAEKSGWTFVHLEGSPPDVGFQHGDLLESHVPGRALPMHEPPAPPFRAAGGILDPEST